MSSFVLSFSRDDFMHCVQSFFKHIITFLQQITKQQVDCNPVFVHIQLYEAYLTQPHLVQLNSRKS